MSIGRKIGRPVGVPSREYLVSDRSEYEFPLFIGTCEEVAQFLGVTKKSVIEMASRDAGQFKITSYKISDLEEEDE